MDGNVPFNWADDDGYQPVEPAGTDGEYSSPNEGSGEQTFADILADVKRALADAGLEIPDSETQPLPPSAEMLSSPTAIGYGLASMFNAYQGALVAAALNGEGRDEGRSYFADAVIRMVVEVITTGITAAKHGRSILWFIPDLAMAIILAIIVCESISAEQAGEDYDPLDSLSRLTSPPDPDSWLNSFNTMRDRLVNQRAERHQGIDIDDVDIDDLLERFRAELDEFGGGTNAA